jgi:S1-C subfamily serine protease
MRFVLWTGTLLAIHGAGLGAGASTLDAQTPAQVVAHVLEEPGWVGIIPDSLDPLRISLVAAGTPAAFVGLLPGDRITRIDGQVATPIGLYHRRFPVGEHVRMTVARGDRQIGTYTLEAVENPNALARVREDSVRREADRYRVVLGRSMVTTDTGQSRIRYSARTVSPSPLIIVDGVILTDSARQLDTTLRARRSSADSAARIVRLRSVIAQQDSQLVREMAYAGAARSNLVARIGSRTAIAGAEVAQLNADLAAYFGGADGVLVIASPPDSPAARAGLRAGDVVYAVNDSTITTVGELLDLVGTARSRISLSVRRRGDRLVVTLRR